MSGPARSAAHRYRCEHGLRRIGRGRRAVQDNIRSRPPDARGVLGNRRRAGYSRAVCRLRGAAVAGLAAGRTKPSVTLGRRKYENPANLLAHERNCSSCCTHDELKDECILRCERERENFAKSAENFGFQFSRHVLQICDRVSSDPCNAAALEHFICMLMNFGASATTEVVCRFSTASCERFGRGYG